MKNYVIAFLAICVVVALSFMYKNFQHPVLDEFPMNHTLKTGATFKLVGMKRVYNRFMPHYTPTIYE